MRIFLMGSGLLIVPFFGTVSQGAKLSNIQRPAEELEFECASGNIDSCCDLGFKLSLPSTTEATHLALPYLERGCDHGRADCCGVLGSAHMSRLVDDTVNYSEAMKYFEKGCQLGDRISCEKLENAGHLRIGSVFFPLLAPVLIYSLLSFVIFRGGIHTLWPPLIVSLVLALIVGFVVDLQDYVYFPLTGLLSAAAYVFAHRRRRGKVDPENETGHYAGEACRRIGGR